MNDDVAMGSCIFAISRVLGSALWCFAFVSLTV